DLRCGAGSAGDVHRHTPDERLDAAHAGIVLAAIEERYLRTKACCSGLESLEGNANRKLQIFRCLARAAFVSDRPQASGRDKAEVFWSRFDVHSVALRR